MTARSAGDTIAAVATPPGRGALAIVRLSGPAAQDIAGRTIDPWPVEPRRATLARIRARDGERLDEAIVVRYPAPASFTGEDVVEVSCHGGPVVAASILAALVSHGARPAEPGEFTRRAVLNGKLDLIQAEAVGDLVDAASRAAQRVALSQLDGGLSRRVLALRDDILGLESLAAYDIDFPEEDDGPIPPGRIVQATQEVISRIGALLATAPTGEIVREGAAVVIAGVPNAGKSSLFNALLGRRRAIVTDIPGTTRDALEAMTDAGGWPIRLVDTAGLRESAETVERLGIEVSREYVERADVVLACGSSPGEIMLVTAAVRAISRAPLVTVRTKSDLMSASDRAALSGEVVAVSAESGEGLDGLRQGIARCLEQSVGALSFDAPLVTRERHRFALDAARSELQQFQDALATQSVPVIVAAVHLREATRHLEELMGTVDVDDVLDRLFRSFCVGK